MNSNKVTALSIMLLASVAGNLHSMTYFNRFVGGVKAGVAYVKGVVCNMVGNEASAQTTATATPALSLTVATPVRKAASMPTPNVTASEAQPSMLSNIAGNVLPFATALGGSIVSGAKLAANSMYEKVVAPIRAYVGTSVYPYAKAYVAGGTMVAGVKSKVALTAATVAGLYGVYKLHQFAFPAKTTAAQQGDVTAKPGFISRFKGAVVAYGKKAQASLTNAFEAAKKRVTRKKATPPAKAAANVTAPVAGNNQEELIAEYNSLSATIGEAFSKAHQMNTLTKVETTIAPQLARLNTVKAELKAIGVTVQ